MTPCSFKEVGNAVPSLNDGRGIAFRLRQTTGVESPYSAPTFAVVPTISPAELIPFTSDASFSLPNRLTLPLIEVNGKRAFSDSLERARATTSPLLLSP